MERRPGRANRRCIFAAGAALILALSAADAAMPLDPELRDRLREARELGRVDLFDVPHAMFSKPVAEAPPRALVA